jgi:hemerythrin
VAQSRAGRRARRPSLAQQNGDRVGTRSSVMTIEWRPAMAVGDEAIDADHRRLIDLINTVELTLQATGGKADLAATLHELSRYTQQHFEREENLMRYLNYNGLIHHRQAHRDLRVQLVKLSNDIAAAKADAVAAGEVDRLVRLLRAWLLDHVLKEDMLLRDFLAKVS